MSSPYIGHTLINHIGKRINVSKRTIDELQKRNLATRGPVPRFKRQYYKLYLDLENGAIRQDYVRELGPDISGPTVVYCSCRKCAEKAMNDLVERYQRTFADLDTDELIEQIKRARKIK